MKSRAGVVLAIAIVATATTAHAADAARGKSRAAACGACHGPLGIAVAPDAPNLAGQPEAYLADQLKAYRGGKRKHEVMSLMAKPLTDTDIGDLSAWFSSLRVEARER